MRPKETTRLKPIEPKTISVSQTSPVDMRTRKVVPIKSACSVIVFFIGGAGDKSTFYGTGPYGNVLDVHDESDKLFKKLLERGLYLREYVAYNEICNDKDVHKYVIDKIPSHATPVYIVGHSLGAWNGAHLSAILTAHKYNVEMLITLDPVGAGAVQMVANLYLLPPTPVSKFWINIRAEAKDTDPSDIIANAGGQWNVIKGPDLNYIAPINHGNALKMFVVPLGKMSAKDYLYASIVKNTEI